MPDNESLPEGEWQHIAAAPTTGPVVWVEVWNGREAVRAHFAYGDGDGLMPPFGPAWFRQRGEGPNRWFEEIIPQPSHWRPLPASNA